MTNPPLSEQQIAEKHKAIRRISRRTHSRQLEAQKPGPVTVTKPVQPAQAAGEPSNLKESSNA